jgi:hypothetical protein
MRQVLHLIDADGPMSQGAALAVVRGAIEQAPDHAPELCLIGGKRLAGDAKSAGLSPNFQAGAPGGDPLRGLASLARAIRPAQSHLIHCWSAKSLLAARLLKPRVPRLTTLAHRPTPAEIRQIRGACWRSRAPVYIATPSPTLAGCLLTSGLNPQQVMGIAPIPPAIEPTQASSETQRQRWIAAGANPNAAMIALLSDPPEAGNVAEASLALGLARESLQSQAGESARRELTLLVPPRGHRRQRAERHLRLLRRQHLMVQEPELLRPWRMADCCELALTLGEAPHAIALARCRGWPVVAEDRPLNREIISQDQNAWLVRAGETKRMAHAIERLVTTPNLADRVTASARETAQPKPFGDRPVPSLPDLYQHLLSEATPRPAATITQLSAPMG